MRSTWCGIVVAGALLALAAPGAALWAQQEPEPAGVPELVRLQALDLGPELAAFRLADLTGDGRQELLATTTSGAVRTWATAPDQPTFESEARGELQLPDPAHTLLALAQLTGGEGAQLVLLSPAGLSLFSADERAVFAPEAVRLSRRARFGLRVGAPTFAPFVQDVNRDGLPDVVVPGGQECELWLNAGPRAQAAESGKPAGSAESGTPGEEAGEPAPPAFQRAALIRVEVERWGSRATRNLSNVLESSFAVPGLQTRDVNGDGRPDLTVVEGQRRAFHLQAADGSFPREATVRLDLGIFRDERTDSGVKPGQSLSIEGGATFSTRDLDGDGIPDYVIAHRRKVWVFRGSSAGPQFTEPSTILKAAEDVTALTVLELDDDGHPDLLLMKVQVPTIATLVRGLIGEWDVSINAAGYRNTGDGTFETRARWKSSVVLRLPAIFSILKDPTALLEQFEQLEQRFRVALWGDLEGDGAEDLALVSEDQTRVDLWFGGRGLGALGDELDADAALRELLFEEQDMVFDLDRAMLWIGGLAEREVALRTGGRAPDTSFELRPSESASFGSLDLVDLDGDGRDELVVGYRQTTAGQHGLFDILGIR